MYIPTWLIIIGAVVVYFIWSSRQGSHQKTILENTSVTVEEIEERVAFVKEHRIFSLEHFDSPHFIDAQNAYDVMEINYLRLKQRLSHSPDRVLEISKDWFRYAGALGDLKSARVMLDVDWSDDASENFDNDSKEPAIIRDEIEKQFKKLLGKDFQKIPPDYFERMETIKKPSKKAEKGFGMFGDWKYYYRDSANLYKLEEKREKEKKDSEAKKQSEAPSVVK